MKILQTNLNNQPMSQTISHKAAYQVVYCISGAKGEVSFIKDKESIQMFQKRILSFLQVTPKKLLDLRKQFDKLKNKYNLTLEQRLKFEVLGINVTNFRDLMKASDIDYRLNPKIRSFYHELKDKVRAFLISGNQKAFNKEAGVENFGKRRAEVKMLREKGKLGPKDETPELKDARRKYNVGGYNYVTFYPRRKKDESGSIQVLRINLEPELDENGMFLFHRFKNADWITEAEYNRLSG